jgi:uncharacterized protein (TIGR02996 family)
MSDRLGMIHAIHEQHDDDLPRLAYADWLEERGEVEHAEFIRIELRLSHLSSGHEDYRPLFLRELELIRAHKDEWFGTFRSGWDGYDMRRGFIEEVSARTPAAVVPYADWLFSHHALLRLGVTGPWREVRPLLSHPLAGILVRLTLCGSQTGLFYNWYFSRPPEQQANLAHRPLVLSLAGHRAGSGLIDDLLASPHRERVTWLDLSGNVLTTVGLQKLLDALPVLPRLKTLALSGSVSSDTAGHSTSHPNIGPAGIDLLANHPAVTQLEQLDLTNNLISPANVQALIDSPFLAGIEKLGIGQGPGQADCRRLRQHFGNRIELPREQPA